MKWYEQQTNEYESLVGRQILNELGPTGYGVYIIIKQIIGQNMADNPDDWGYVSKSETITSLAEKCHVSEDQFRAFITFFDQRFILEKRNGRLFCPSILEETNNYAKKVVRTRRSSNDKSDGTYSTNNTNSTYSTDSTDKDDMYDLAHVTITTQLQPQLQPQSNLDKSKLVEEPPSPFPKGDKRSKIVNHVLEEFKRIYKFYPTDKKPRYVAHNLIQRIGTVTTERFGGELSDERLMKGITRFFDWLALQDGLEGIQKLETAKLKLNIFMETLPRKESNAKND